jgi:hypothetical protein
MRKALRKLAEQNRNDAQMALIQGRYDIAKSKYKASQRRIQDAKKLHQRYGNSNAEERFKQRYKRELFDNR